MLSGLIRKLHGIYALDKGQNPYDYDSEAFDRREQGVF